MRSSICILLLCAAVFSSCKKDNDPDTDNSAMTSVSVEFDNIVGGQNLFLNSVNYTNAAGETFNVSTLRYFISNISLRKTDGTLFTVEQDSSYFLVSEDAPESRFARFSAPVGDYDRLIFTIGVDSLRSTMDIGRRTGVLTPGGDMNDGMYWTWNSGYIFFKMEGISGSAPLDPAGEHKYRYHIGGFGGYSAPTLNNLRRVEIDLTRSGIAQARAGRQANIHLLADVLKMFNGATPGANVSIAENATVMFSEYSRQVSDNYRQMFTHDHTEN